MIETSKEDEGHQGVDDILPNLVASVVKNDNNQQTHPNDDLSYSFCFNHDYYCYKYFKCKKRKDCSEHRKLS